MQASGYWCCARSEVDMSAPGPAGCTRATGDPSSLEPGVFLEETLSLEKILENGQRGLEYTDR